MEDADWAAVARVKAGDSDGFRMLVDRHSRSVFRLAYRITGNAADAEDVVQETFLRAYRHLDRYEVRSSFATWVNRIAANCALDLLRSRRRVAEPDELLFERLQSNEPGQDRLVLSAQIQEHFERTLASLSAQERTAFEMRHFDGMSIEQIGEYLSLGESAAKNSVFRAVRKLRAALEPLVGRTEAV